MGAAVDCELIRSGFFGQPDNTITTLGFFIAGGWLLRRPNMKWVGVGLVATGAGSLVFHGPMPSWGEWAHDVTLAWLILLVGGLGTRWERWSRLPGLAVLAALFAILPLTADPVAIALAVIVVASIVLRREGRRTLAPLALLGAVAILGRLGATDWPLCDPTSVWQLHGLWHIGAAVAVAWWAVTATDRPTDL